MATEKGELLKKQWGWGEAVGTEAVGLGGSVCQKSSSPRARKPASRHGSRPVGIWVGLGVERAGRRGGRILSVRLFRNQIRPDRLPLLYADHGSTGLGE